MSCWVVPSVAAELWGVAVETILAKARSGVIPSKTENGFLFIDIAPSENPGCRLPRELRPPTYTAVTPEELAALQTAERETRVEAHAPDDWRVGRRLAARTRRAPRTDAA